MSDPVLLYLTSCQEELVVYFAEVVRSEARRFPSYNKLEQEVLQTWIKRGLKVHIRGVEQGDFTENKEAIHRIFSQRIRSGFNPNELIRMTDMTTSLVTQAIDYAPGADEALRKLYRQRSESIAQVAKMYIAILNLSIPKEERNEIDPALLEVIS